MRALGLEQVKERPLAARLAARLRRVLELLKPQGKLAAMRSMAQSVPTDA